MGDIIRRRFVKFGCTWMLLFAVPGVWAQDDASIWHTAASQYDLDPVVLYALALQESRRMRPDGMVRPWPWTLHAQGHGSMYFDSYEEAREKLNGLLEDGVRNIDIGLMQINWGANGHLLPDASEILKPRQNVTLGAAILRRELDRRPGDLPAAIGLYHSPSTDRGRDYARSVLTILRGLRELRGFSAALIF